MADIDSEHQAFRNQLQAEVEARAQNEEGPGSLTINAFTAILIDELGGQGFLTDGRACHSEKKVGRSTARVNGYGIDEDEGRLDLFVTLFDEGTGLRVVPRDEVLQAVKEAAQYYEAAIAGKFQDLEEALPESDMARRILESHADIKQLRIFVLTNNIVASEKQVRPDVSVKKAIVEVWDLVRLARARASGSDVEPIEIDFTEVFGAPLPCLPLPSEPGTYQGYLIIFPGEVLQKIYDQFGERLLELNVRSFLQVRGKVNKGIQATLLEEPENFFAYNNGISAVAEGVDLVSTPRGPAIKSVRKLQIVNGGQTTASIHLVATRFEEKVDLAKVFVQAKLSVVPKARLEELVPRISRNANSQNKVNDADFSANEPFHQWMEKVSRTVWCPDQRTRWFYERARGQYQVGRARQYRASERDGKTFDRLYPQDRMFTKTDLASSENTWDQRPFAVSAGGQKNFLAYSERHRDDHRAEVVDGFSEHEYRNLVARLIVFRAIQSTVKDLKIPAYRANVVTYTGSWLVHHAGTRLDLDRVWLEQGIPEPLRELVSKVAQAVDVTIRKTARERNVTEWCKKPDCWEAVREVEVDVPRSFWPKSAKAPAVTSSRPVTANALEAPLNRALLKSDLPRALRTLGVEVIDDRDSGGELWLVGDASQRALVGRLKQEGLAFAYALKGHAATGRRPAWKLQSR